MAYFVNRKSKQICKISEIRNEYLIKYILVLFLNFESNINFTLIW